jgi:phage terminase large subunit GpA-like protein
MTKRSSLARDFRFHKVNQIRVDEWADSFRRLPSASAASGRWRTEAVELARGPMRAFDEPGVRFLTLCFAVQVGKTEAILNIIGRAAHLDPTSMMVVYPKREACDKFTRERLMPMIRECPELAKKFDVRMRAGLDSLKFKQFEGGFLAVESAGSPMDLASRAVKIVLMDEIDKFESTREGEPVKLAEARLATFGDNAKSVRICSPTITDRSRIWKLYQESDRRRAFIGCEHCGFEMSPRFFPHVQWAKSEDGSEHFPATAAIFCEKCGMAWSEDYRRKQVTTKLGIKWKQTAAFTCCGILQDPMQTQLWRWDEENQIDRAICSECGKLAVPNTHAGYQASQLLSPFITIPALATEWIEAKDSPEDKLTFRNTRLGEPADTALISENIDVAELMARREAFPDKLPADIAGLFAGVDVQTGSDVSDGSLHCYIWGYAVNREMWSVHTSILVGDVRLPGIWNQLDELLLSRFEHQVGGQMIVQAAAIDTGDGKISDVVVEWCRKRRSRNIFAIKGMSERSASSWGEIWPAVQAERSRHSGFRVKMIGSNAAKMAIYQRLGLSEPGPGFMHFGQDWDVARFQQLTAEKYQRVKRGQFEFRRFFLPRGRANEALDSSAYSLAALQGWIAKGNSLEKSKRYLDNVKGS